MVSRPSSEAQSSPSQPDLVRIRPPSGVIHADASIDAAIERARAQEPVATIVMMISYGAFFLLLLVRHYLTAGVSEADERRLYLFTSAFAPPVGLAAGWLMTRARKMLFRESVAFPIAMVLSNVLFWAVGLFYYKRSIAMIGEAQLATKTTTLVTLFVVVNAVAFAGCLVGRRIRVGISTRQVVRHLADDAYLLVPVAAAFSVGAFSNYNLTRWATLVFLGVCALPALAPRGLGLGTGVRAARLIDATAIVLVVGIIFNANYPFDEHHYSFFLGPVASLIGGRRPLVDINCQYGVGVVYFLAAFFKLHVVPLAYQGMSAILSVLGIVQFLTIYVLLRLCLRSRWYCLLALLVMLAVRVFAGPHFYVKFPSLGPLRFMWGYFLLLCIALRERFPRLSALFRALEVTVVAVTSVWSAEAFAGTAATFLAILGYEVLFGDARLSRRVVQALKTLGAAMVAVAVAHALLTFDIRMHTGQWPHWSQYFAYLVLYSSIGFWAAPITTWEPWAPVALVYFASLVALLARRTLFGRTGIALEHKIVWGMTILGIVEFSHYIGRSHVDHLRIYMADIFVAAYWLDRTAAPSVYVAPAFRKSFLACAYAAIGLLFLSALPGFAQKFGDTLFGRIAADLPVVSPWGIDRDAPWRGTPRAKLKEDAINLIRKYQPERRNVALFMDQFIRPIVLLHLEKAHTWPMSLPYQDEGEPSARARILAYADGLKEGDIIFICDDLPVLEQEILAGLKKRFRFSQIEASSSGIKAVRLDPLS